LATRRPQETRRLPSPRPGSGIKVQVERDCTEQQPRDQAPPARGGAAHRSTCAFPWDRDPGGGRLPDVSPVAGDDSPSDHEQLSTAWWRCGLNGSAQYQEAWATPAGRQGAWSGRWTSDSATGESRVPVHSRLRRDGRSALAHKLGDRASSSPTATRRTDRCMAPMCRRLLDSVVPDPDLRDQTRIGARCDLASEVMRPICSEFGPDRCPPGIIPTG
jgi:hypothetical protein